MNMLHQNKPQLSSLRLFQLRGDLAKTSVAAGEGVCVLYVNNPKLENPKTVPYVFHIDLGNLYFGDFTQFACDIVANVGHLPDNNYRKTVEQTLVKQVSDYVRSLFRFKNCSQDNPKLVFVANITLPNDDYYNTLEQQDDDDENVTITFEPTILGNNDYSHITPTGWDSSAPSDYYEFTICQGLNDQHGYNNDVEDDDEFDDSDNEESSNNSCVTDNNDYNNEIEKIVIDYLMSWTTEKTIRNEKIRLNEVQPAVEIIQEATKKEGLRERLCSICLELMTIEEEEELVRVVECNHVFHLRCITEWLPMKQSCPNCRASSLVDVFL